MARMIIRALVLSSTVLAVAAPGAAARTFCVNTGGCPPADSHANLQNALDEAGSNPGPDEVRVGAPDVGPSPGNYSYSPAAPANNPVHVIGSGRAGTVLTNGGLLIGVAGSSVRDLTYDIDPGGGTALTFAAGGTASNVLVKGGDNSSSAIAFGGGSGRVERTDVSLPDSSGFAVVASGTSTVVVEGGRLEAGSTLVVAEATLEARRVHAIATRTAAVQGVNGATFTVEDSVLRASNTSGNSFGVFVSGSGSTITRGTLNHVTVWGSGGALSTPSFGVAATDSDAGGSSRVDVRNSIIRNAFYTLFRSASGGGQADIHLAHSDFDAFHVLDQNSSGGTGAISQGPGNIDENPRFLNPAGGDFRVPQSSPVVNAGDPAGGGGLDFAGNPRISGGRRDMGALEFQFPGPPSGGGGGGSGATQPKAGASFGATSITVGANGKGSVRLRCNLPAPLVCNFNLGLEAGAAQVAQRKRKAAKVGTLKGKVRGGKAGKVPLRLNRKGRRALKKRRKLSVRARGTVKARGASTSRVNRKLTLKLKKKAERRARR